MSDALQPRHASRRPRALRIALPVGLAVTALGALWAIAEIPGVAGAELPPMPVAAAQLPVIDVAGVTAADPCSEPAVVDALGAGDDEAAIAAFGGGAAFRDAMVVGNAPCISLTDPARRWVIVNKTLSLNPVDYAPAPLSGTSVETTTRSNQLRGDAASALNEMAAALHESGAGVLGMNNGYRSYRLQVATHAGHVSSLGQTAADRVSARPGFSEHQTGLSMDLVACSNGCGEIGAFGGTRESEWVAEHAWEHGFIVRYEEGVTDTTGYVQEPWHMRYIGPALASAYHDSGCRSLEEFFGLPAAPDYAH
ncbi:M15 family metallopeptidase [Microbacterium sp. A93]|uniref:M15 family metallopeptidase n=1 Tax=Microbacterium sp. A93 TaxID=3450716 RepID=UPI003F42EA3F